MFGLLSKGVLCWKYMVLGGIFGLLIVWFGNELESCMCGFYWVVGCCC